MKKFISDSRVWVVRGIKGFNFEVRLASEMAKTLMKLNAANVDVAALKALKVQRPDGITEEDISTILYVGKTVRTPLPPAESDDDNPKGGIPCSTCGEHFNAIRYNNRDGERRGSVTELKSERFDQMVKDAKDETLPAERREFAARFLKASDDLGAILMKGRKFQNVRFFATCPRDVSEERKGRDGIYISYLTIADALEQAAVHDARIAGGKTRSYVKGLKKGLTNFRRPGENRSDNRRDGGNFRGGQRWTDDRPRNDFHGASYLQDTAMALVAAEKSGKLSGGLEQLASASNDFLKTLGIEGSERAFDAVRTIASRTLERQVAESNPAPTSDSQPTSGATLADSPSAKNLGNLKFTSQKPAPRRSKNKGPRQSKADRIKN